jgi:hypothetical protein
MIEDVARYQTNDGSVFETLEDAENYELDLIREIIDQKLSGFTDKFPEIRRHHIISIITYMIDDHSSVDKLIDRLYKIIN